MAQLIILVAMFALLWVLLIRPQRAKQQHQKRLLDTIEPGDEILTVGGLYGIVQEIDEEDDLIVEIADGIQVRIARRAVGGVVKPDDDDEDEDVEEPSDDDAAELDEETMKDSKELVSSEAAEATEPPEHR